MSETSCCKEFDIDTKSNISKCIEFFLSFHIFYIKYSDTSRCRTL